MIGIYKITNLVNGKFYIGQSVNIKRRWSDHKRKGESEVSKEIIKFGVENFKFEVLEQCRMEDLNERELYYLMKYQPFFPNGYNKAPPNKTSYTKNNEILSEEELSQVIAALVEQTPVSEVAKRFNLNSRTIYRINNGETYFREGFNYPLLKNQKDINFCPICGVEIAPARKYCSKRCSELGQTTEGKPDRETLKKEIKQNSFVELGKKYGVSDNGIRKWCKSYNLPYRKNEMKKYSEEEWRDL